MNISPVTAAPVVRSTLTAAPAAPAAVDLTDGRATADAFAAQLKALRDAARERGVEPFTSPFKLQMEVKGTNAAAAQRLLGGTQWTVSALSGNNHNHGGDCSHTDDGGGAAFVRVQSPFLTVDRGGFQAIADVTGRLAASGADPGRTGALRINVHDVPDTTLGRMVNVHLGHEDILYRLSRAGGPGRSLGHKKRFAVPLSRKLSSKDTVQKIRTVMASRHASINTSTMGQLEFRYFDSTLHAPALQANVSLVLGTVAAASDGRLGEAGRHPVGRFNWFVGANRWNHFIRETVGDGPLRTQLEQQFRSAGGRIW